VTNASSDTAVLLPAETHASNGIFHFRRQKDGTRWKSLDWKQRGNDNVSLPLVAALSRDEIRCRGFSIGVLPYVTIWQHLDSQKRLMEQLYFVVCSYPRHGPPQEKPLNHRDVVVPRFMNHLPRYHLLASESCTHEVIFQQWLNTGAQSAYFQTLLY
jgi:hypothetical protein